MQNRLPIFLLIFLSGLALAESTPDVSDATTGDSKLKAWDPNGGEGRQILMIPIEGTIDLGLAPFVERVIEKATKDDIIIVKIKTFGGRVDAAVRIRDALLGSKAHTVAYIDRRAISAGALISLACETIIMSEGASIGAATPVTQGEGGKMQATSEKVVSYMRAEMRATAEAHKRRVDLAEAMVDADIVVKDVIEKGKLLTLTSAKAKELGLADAVAASFEDAIKLLNLTKAKRSATDTDWGERLARILTDPTVSSLLMTFGMVGLLFELYTPGFGVGGFIGVSCLFLFFLGQYAASLAGLEELLLFLGGALFIALEVFIIPGFGIAGVAGLVMLFIALMMAMVEVNVPWDVASDLGYIREAFEVALSRFALSLVALMVAAFFLGKYFPGSRFGKFLILETATSTDKGYTSFRDNPEDLLGEVGITSSVLRPMGSARFGDRIVEVSSHGDLIEKGMSIKVVQVDGRKVVVEINTEINKETNKETNNEIQES